MLYSLRSMTALGLCLAAPALAQEAPVLAQPTAEQPAAEGTEVTGDIIVTASKRAQTLQDTPISVAVATAASIEQSQIRDLLDLQTLVPSLKVGQLQSSANTNFSIRGFGNGANNAGIEPSVGVFIDGVYRSRSAAQIGDLPNIDRVEVLRGPQSTLFGKNASAGIISIVTAEPKFDFAGQVEASYGNYDAVVVKGNVTGPISDTIAVSLGGNYNRRDGYIFDVGTGEDTNNRNRYGVRGQVLFQPSEDLKFRLIGDYDKIDEECCGVANLVNGPTGAIVDALAGGQGLNPNNSFTYTTFGNFASENRIKNYGVSLQGDLNLGSLALTSITAYRRVDSFTNQDSDFTSADLIGRNAADLGIKTFTQELRLATDFDGPFNVLVGGFYFNEKIEQENQLFFGSQFRPFGDQLIRAASGNALSVATLEAALGAAPGSFFRQGDGLDERYDFKNEAFSLFGTADFEIVDGLTLTGGLNYTKDKKRFAINTTSTDVFSSTDLDAPQFAPYRNQLILGGQLAAAGVDPTNTAQVIAFATNPATAATYAQFVATANANQNNPAANPLAGLRAFQFLPPFLNLPNAVEDGRLSDDNISYTARIAYKASNRLSVYATYATGYKASSINLSRDSRPTPADLAAIRTAGFATPNLSSGSRSADPEESEVYEVGVKGSFKGFGFNLAVFKQILKGFQSNIFSGTGFILGNAEKQSTIGFEIDATLTPDPSLTFTAALTYLDPVYDSYPSGSIFSAATNTVIPADLTGLKPSGIAEWSLAVGTTYTHEFSESVRGIFHVDYDFQSAYQIVLDLPYKAQPETLNASVTIALENGLELTAWGRNLTEPKFNPVIFPSVAQGGSLSAYPSPPRTYGVSARFKF